MSIDYSRFTDEKLIEMYRNGDAGVVSYVCDKYKPLVLKNAKPLFIAGAENEDLIQEGMIGLFLAIGDYDTSSEVTFFHFANICIRNQMFKAIEASNRKKNSPLNSYVSIFDDEDSENEDLYFANQNPESIFIEKEAASRFSSKLLAKLSPLEKQVFELYIEGLDYKEISEKLGKEDKAIDNALTRIKSKARKIYE